MGKRASEWRQGDAVRLKTAVAAAVAAGSSIEYGVDVISLEGGGELAVDAMLYGNLDDNIEVNLLLRLNDSECLRLASRDIENLLVVLTDALALARRMEGEKIQSEDISPFGGVLPIS